MNILPNSLGDSKMAGCCNVCIVSKGSFEFDLLDTNLRAE
jgi:hypothetical protein